MNFICQRKYILIMAKAPLSLAIKAKSSYSALSLKVHDGVYALLHIDYLGPFSFSCLLVLLPYYDINA